MRNKIAITWTFAALVGAASCGPPTKEDGPVGGSGGSSPSNGGMTGNNNSGGSGGTSPVGSGGVSGTGGIASGGTTGGGSGGVSGSGTCMPAGASEIVFNDFESGTVGNDGGTCVPFTDGDPATMITPPKFMAITPVEANCNGTSAGHIVATNVKYSAGLNCEAGEGMTVNNVWTPKAVDGTTYTGVSFWARVSADSAKTLRVMAMDGNNHPAGGVCKEAMMECWNFPGKVVTLSTDWKHITVNFADMKQQSGFGKMFPAVDKTKLYGVQLAFGLMTTKGELWVDNVAWVK